MHLLAIATLLLSAADHWTTYLCLRTPVEGWEVAEANPLANWLFDALGLVPGLLVDSVVTVAAVAFLLTTQQVPRVAKFAFFGLVIVATTVAVVNNYQALLTMGLSPLGGIRP